MKLLKNDLLGGGGHLALLLVGAMLSLALPSAAADGTWTAVGTNLDWWDPANWQDGIVGGGAGTTVTVGSVGDASVNLTNSVSFKDLAMPGDGHKAIAGTGSIVLAEVQGGNDVSSFTLSKYSDGRTAYLNVDVPVSGNMSVMKRGSGTLYLNARCTTTGPFRLDGGVFCFDWSRVADSPSPTNGGNNVTANILPVTDVNVTQGSTMLCNPRISRSGDQSLNVTLSADSRVVSLPSSSSMSAGQQVVSDGFLPSGTYIQRIPDTNTIELSAMPLASGTAAITVKAAPQFYSQQTFSSLNMGSSLQLGLNEGCRVFAQKMTGTRELLLLRPGRLIVADAIDYTGTITLTNSANLSCENVRPIPAGLPVTNGLVFRMDASDASTLTLAGDEVTSWRTVDGAGDITATPAGSTHPVLLRNALNGLPVVDMGPAVDDGGMAWSAPVSNIRTFFVVLGSQAGGGTVLGADGALEGYCFQRQSGELHLDALRRLRSRERIPEPGRCRCIGFRPRGGRREHAYRQRRRAAPRGGDPLLARPHRARAADGGGVSAAQVVRRDAARLGRRVRRAHCGRQSVCRAKLSFRPVGQPHECLRLDG